jgi:acetyl esterase/lipase
MHRVYAQVIGQTITGYGSAMYDTAMLSDIPYTNTPGDPYQTVDIEYPSTGTGPFPVMVFLHGGGWRLGDKTDDELEGHLDAAIANGYAVARVNYRLAPNSPWPAQIYDSKAAVRFLRENAEKYSLDPENIGVIGCSAGGHLALMLGTTNGDPVYEDLSMGSAGHSSDVKMVVALYPVTDPVTWNLPFFVDPLLGADATEEEKKAASPYWQLTADDVPMYIAAGMNDTLVPAVPQSVAFVEKATEVLGADKITTYFPAEAAHADETFWNSSDMVRRTFGMTGPMIVGYVDGQLFNPYRRPPFSLWGIDYSSYPNATLGIQYAEQSATQVMDVILPSEGEGPFPTIVFVHGGGWTGGNKELYTAGGALQALERGYAVAAVDYRLAGEAQYPAPIYDI